MTPKNKNKDIVFANIHNSIVHASKKLQTIQMFINW